MANKIKIMVVGAPGVGKTKMAERLLLLLARFGGSAFSGVEVTVYTSNVLDEEKAHEEGTAKCGLGLYTKATRAR